MNELITMYENSVVITPKKECAGYSAWRATFQSSEAAAKSAYDDASNLHDDVLVLEQARSQDQDRIKTLEAEIAALERKALIISKANEQLAERCKEIDELKDINSRLCNLINLGFGSSGSYKDWKKELKTVLSEWLAISKGGPNAG